MSARATTWVFEHSPYPGTPRLIHLVIADVVNDSDDNRFWLGEKKLAAKAFCSVRTVERAVARMIEDGYLEVINGRRSPERLREYRFLMPPWATTDRDPDRKTQFEMYAGTVRLTDEALGDLVDNMHRAKKSLLLDDVESAERELLITRHTLDVAQLTTVDSITKRDPSPDVRSEFFSIAGDLRRLLASKSSEETANETEH